jgi:hypothetical protein
LDQHQQRWIMLSYDIWCSYSKKLKTRFAEKFPSSAAILEKMRGAVPKMHVKNHIEACQHLWAFNFLRYSGETYGEMIETAWAENNQAAGSTKEMNDGHRHDTLDDLTNHWNWSKLIVMSASCLWPCELSYGCNDILTANRLEAQYSQNLKYLKDRESRMVDQSARYSEELLNAWKEIDDTVVEKNGKVISPFEAQLKNGLYCQFIHIET